MNLDLDETLQGLKEFEFTDGKWTRHPWTYEEWRRTELAGMPKYWALQAKIADMPPFLRAIHEKIAEWDCFARRPM